MSYVKHSFCNGIIPKQYAGGVSIARNNLLAYMMRNREVVRYVLAPFGFGKSLLVRDYAAMVNAFERTFWLEADNPCFLRDLDAGTLLPDILDESTLGDLIVFDNVPYLGATRRDKVWEMCTGLLAGEREVVVCANPTAHPLRDHEEACITVGAQDLLYSERERTDLRNIGINLRQDMPALHPVGKVPFLALCSQNSFCQFLREHLDEVDDSAQRALSFALLMLEQGTFEELEVLLGTEICAEEIAAQSVRAFMTVDEYSGDFAALGFPLKEVLSAFAPYMRAIAQEIGADDVSELVIRVADILIARGNALRASQLLVQFCDAQTRCDWLVSQQQALLNMCALVPAETIYGSIRSERLRTKPELYTASCIRRAYIDYSEGALDALTQVAYKIDYPLALRLEAAAYAYLLVEDEGHAAELEALFQSQKNSLKREVPSLDASMAALWTFWSKASADVGKLDAFIAKLDGQNDIMLSLACCIHKARVTGVQVKDLPHVQTKVEQAFESPFVQQNVSACVLLRREVDAYGLGLDMSHMAFITAYHRCDSFEDDLEVQRTSYAYNKVARTGAVSTALHLASARNRLKNKGDAKSAVPPLKVNLFGGFSASIGDTVFKPSDFKRKKVRTLLALLVLNSGHDLSCDNIAERLWPDSSSIQARHNLYNSISILRRSILLNDGTCPYLRRMHGIVGIEDALIESDISRCKQLCDSLRFSEPDPNTYLGLLDQIRSVYRGDLLPSENGEPMLIAARAEWRNRVVNTLLEASRRLSGIGDNSGALQFAEQALSYDVQREDCYEQLMSLQARTGQRPAAIKTWLRYRSYMSEELGLDPSQRMSDMYSRILNEKV